MVEPLPRDQPHHPLPKTVSIGAAEECPWRKIVDLVMRIKIGPNLVHQFVMQPFFLLSREGCDFCEFFRWLDQTPVSLSFKHIITF